MTHYDLNTGTDELLANVQDGVATLTLNRPNARNALSDTLTPALRSMLAQCDADPAIGAIVITGAGTAFCAGGDVKAMGRAAPVRTMSRNERIAQLVSRQRTLTGVLVASRKPSIAALPGPAAGAGLALALACDIRIASETAFIQTGYAGIGLPGDYGISWLLTRTVGPAIARELMLLSKRIDAARCKQIGIFNIVTAEADLRETAFAVAAALASGPRSALSLIKDNLDDALHRDFVESMDSEAARMVDASGSVEHQQAVRAFLNRPRAGRE